MMPAQEMLRAVIFDLDGTLIDSAPAILDSFAAVLAEHGLEPVVPLSHDLIGPPLAETLARLSGRGEPELIESLAAGFKRHYDTAGVLATRPFTGVEAMLDAWSATGADLHICTNKRYSVTRAILDHLGWADRFVSVYAIDLFDPRPAGKPQVLAKQLNDQKIDAAAAVYVGDRDEDGHAAAANGLPFYYAAWGYGGAGQGMPGCRRFDRPQDLVPGAVR
jgi:phosphoglycolate phosphatase